MKHSPYRAARRAAARLLPPTQIGGPGCAGGGATITSSNVKCLPAYEKRSPPQASFRISMVSSVRAPRSPLGTPSTRELVRLVAGCDPDIEPAAG